MTHTRALRTCCYNLHLLPVHLAFLCSGTHYVMLYKFAMCPFHIPDFSGQMVTIWNEEKKHIKCIQDPPGVALYTVTGCIKKGGVQLPVF